MNTKTILACLLLVCALAPQAAAQVGRSWSINDVIYDAPLTWSIDSDPGGRVSTDTFGTATLSQNTTFGAFVSAGTVGTPPNIDGVVYEFTVNGNEPPPYKFGVRPLECFRSDETACMTHYWEAQTDLATGARRYVARANHDGGIGATDFPINGGDRFGFEWRTDGTFNFYRNRVCVHSGTYTPAPGVSYRLLAAFPPTAGRTTMYRATEYYFWN